MKKRNLILNGLLSIVITSGIIFSCSDEFTEQDLINQLGQDSVQLSVVVVNASTTSILNSGRPSGSNGGRNEETNGLAGMTVTLPNASGQLISKITDTNGIAIFRNLEPGTIAGTVSGTDFTTANFVVAIRNTSPDDPFTSAGVVIPVFETVGPNTATVSGTVTAELNLLNDTRENVPDGTNIGFTISAAQISSEEDILAFLAQFLTDVSSIGIQNADVTSLTYEGGFNTTTTGGNFTINLPTSPEGLTYEVEFSDFSANQSIAINNFENEIFGMRRDVQTINTLFAQSTNESFGGGTRIDIPGLDPVQFDVAPPPAPGAGATISATLLPQSVGGSFTVLAPGGGYPVSSTSIPVTVNGGDFDSGVPGAAAAVLTANSNAAGQITSIGGTLGFGYRSQATLTIGGGGTGAIVRVNYSSSVASPFGSGTTSGTTITAGGSGYFIAPNVLFRGFDFNGQAVEGSATGELVSGGALVNFTSPGTTFAFLSGPPIIQPVNPATSTVSFYNINNNGVLTGVFLNSGGAGYNPGIPPVVTVRDLRTPGGTGAQIHASTSTAGTVDNFVVITGGSAYSTTSTANFPSSAESFLFTTENDGGDLEDNRTIIVLRPGVNRIISVHYGTGIRSRGVE